MDPHSLFLSLRKFRRKSGSKLDAKTGFSEAGEARFKQVEIVMTYSEIKMYMLTSASIRTSSKSGIVHSMVWTSFS